VLPEPVPPVANGQPPPTLSERLVALTEVLICSDYPTQLALGATFSALGYGPYGPQGRLQVGYVVGLSLLDAVVLIGLVLLFLRAHGERPRDVLFGSRPLAGEARYGVPLVAAALVIGTTVLLAVRYAAPFLHTVEENPLQALLSRPRDVWLFALVLVVAGGIREEIQRAFLLHRFERWLGGGTLGLVVTSVAFGAGHLLQGADAMLVTGILGAFWGAVYLRRRSAMAPIVSHAGFDLLQLVQFFVAGH
jgi:membrane protease YdiL (CAAX protease family)